MPLPTIICRQCGMKHQSPVACPCCKTATPSYCVIKGMKRG